MEIAAFNVGSIIAKLAPLIIVLSVYNVKLGIK